MDGLKKEKERERSREGRESVQGKLQWLRIGVE